MNRYTFQPTTSDRAGFGPGPAATISGRRTVLKEHSAIKFPRGLSVPTTWLGALGLSCLSLACTRTPDERMTAIARLLEEARSFQAAHYVPSELARAEGLLSEVRGELAAQRGKPWFLSHRRRVRELLHDAEVAASLVHAEAAAAVVRARQEAARRVSGAHAALDQASEAYWRAPRGRDTRADVLRMRSDLDQLLKQLTAAELALEQGDFLLAERRAAGVEERARKVERTIDRATSWSSKVLGPDAPDAPPRAPARPQDKISPGVPDPPSRAPAPPPPVASPRPETAVPPGRRAG